MRQIMLSACTAKPSLCWPAIAHIVPLRPAYMVVWVLFGATTSLQASVRHWRTLLTQALKQGVAVGGLHQGSEWVEL